MNIVIPLRCKDQKQMNELSLLKSHPLNKNQLRNYMQNPEMKSATHAGTVKSVYPNQRIMINNLFCLYEYCTDEIFFSFMNTKIWIRKDGSCTFETLRKKTCIEFSTSTDAVCFLNCYYHRGCPTDIAYCIENPSELRACVIPFDEHTKTYNAMIERMNTKKAKRIK